MILYNIILIRSIFQVGVLKSEVLVEKKVGVEC